MRNPIKTNLVAIVTLALLGSLLILAPIVGAQTVTPGGINHVGAEEIANDAASGGDVLGSVRDNTYISTCVRADAGGKLVAVNVTNPVRYVGGWTPDQPYNPCTGGIVGYGNSEPGPPEQPGNHYVVSTYPAKTEPPAVVSDDVIITATFSEPVNMKDDPQQQFVLVKGGVKMAALVSYDEQTYTATLEPVAPLPKGKYTAIVHKSVKDLAGRKMANEYRWSFMVK